MRQLDCGETLEVDECTLAILNLKISIFDNVLLGYSIYMSGCVCVSLSQWSIKLSSL